MSAGAAPEPGPAAVTGPSPRRELTLVVIAGVVAAGLVLVALRQTWVVEVVPRPAPFPDQRVHRTGTDLWAPAAALAWVALAGVGALLATRGGARRMVGAVLALAGAGLVIGIAGAAAGSGAGAGWPALVVAGGALVAGVGVVAVLRQRRWPAMGARYERRAARRPAAEAPTGADQMWEALDRGDDPTAR